MKHVFGTINLKFKIQIHLYVRIATVPLNPPFKHSTCINKILKIINQFKKLDKNIQRYLGKTLCRKGRI